jgi:TonB family protein
MKTFAKALALVAGLAPVAADARCCCDHAGHHRVSARDDWSYETRHRVVREDFDELDAVSTHTCRNYPASAAPARGTSWVSIRVGDDGWVVASRISRSSGSAALDRAALRCVANWHFRHGYDWRAVKIAWRWHGDYWG